MSSSPKQRDIPLMAVIDLGRASLVGVFAVRSLLRTGPVRSNGSTFEDDAKTILDNKVTGLGMPP